MAREVFRFVIGALIAALLVMAGAIWAVSQAGAAGATDDAELVTSLDAHAVVQPLLTPALLAGDAAAIQTLDTAVHQRILGARVVRVKVWAAQGDVVYSDAHALIGQRFTLGGDELQSLRTGNPHTALSNLNEPENRFERSFGSLVEAYVPVTATGGTRLLFETYQPESAVHVNDARIWTGLLPILVAALFLFLLVQLSLAWRLGHRLERGVQERTALLQRAIESSDTERRLIASDLHDGPVQNLTAVSLTLSAAAARLGGDAAPEVDRQDLVGVLSAAKEEARAAIHELRNLIVEIAPPDLSNSGLVPALDRLLAAARDTGLRTEFDSAGQLELTPEVTALVYRVAQESVRNVVKHAHATSVTATLRLQEDGMVSLDVWDDGVGFSQEDLLRRRYEGHIGLSLLRDRAIESGAAFEIDSKPGGGTRVGVRVRNA